MPQAGFEPRQVNVYLNLTHTLNRSATTAGYFNHFIRIAFLNMKSFLFVWRATSFNLVCLVFFLNLLFWNSTYNLVLIKKYVFCLLCSLLPVTVKEMFLVQRTKGYMWKGGSPCLKVKFKATKLHVILSRVLLKFSLWCAHPLHINISPIFWPLLIQVFW